MRLPWTFSWLKMWPQRLRRGLSSDEHREHRGLRPLILPQAFNTLAWLLEQILSYYYLCIHCEFYRLCFLGLLKLVFSRANKYLYLFSGEFFFVFHLSCRWGYSEMKYQAYLNYIFFPVVHQFLPIARVPHQPMVALWGCFLNMFIFI